MSKRFRNGEVDPKRMVCAGCLRNRCNECVDVLHALWGLDLICTCKRVGHEGEPRDQQIADPETGAVYTPGLKIATDGEVEKL